MIRVLLVDRDPLMCETLAGILERDGEIRVIGHVAGPYETWSALDVVSGLDVVVCRDDLPGNGTLALARRLRASGAPSLLVYGIDHETRLVLRYLETGPWNQGSEVGTAGDLVGAVKTLARGETPLPAAQRDLERLLETERGRWQRLFGALPMACAITCPGGEIRELNPAGELLLGRPLADLEGQSMLAWVREPRNGPRRNGGTGVPIVDGADLAMIVTPVDGTMRPTTARLVGLRAADGALLGVIWFLRDPCGDGGSKTRKEPLRSGAASPQGPGEDPALAPTPTTIESIGEDHMMRAAATDTLRTGRGRRIASPTGDDRHVLDVRPLLEATVSAFRTAAARRRLDLRLEAPESLPPVGAEGSRVLEVLAILLENANSRIPPGSWIALRATKTLHRVRLSVADNGPGLSEAERERLFEADRAGPGWPGSLRPCRETARALGGDLRIDTEPGVGTTLHLILPALGRDVAVEARPGASGRGGRGGRVDVSA